MKRAYIGRIVGVLGRGLNQLNRLLSIVGGYTLFAIALLVTIDVCLRYLFNHPLGITFEVSGLALLMLTWLCLPELKEEKHIRIDQLVNVLSGSKVGYVMETFGTAVTCLFFGLVTLYGVLAALKAWQISDSSELVNIPFVIPWSGMTIGAFLTAIGLLARLIARLRKPSEFIGPQRKRDLSKSVEDLSSPY
jgi:TRAP-type C4-dicarboxylate transport system permease small subunit